MPKPRAHPFETGETAKAPPLGPLLAGARARGVADGLAWIGLAAILIDDRGETLHVSDGARALLGGALYLADGRLRARDPGADRELSAAVRDALTLGEPGHVQVGGADGEVWAYIAPMPAEEDDPYQLLRAVALLSRARDWAPARHGGVSKM